MINVGISYWRALIVAACGILMAGCSSNGSPVSAAIQVANQYYQAMKNKDFDKASAFFKQTVTQPQALWLEQIKDRHDKLGDVESYELADTIVNTIYSGTRYTLRYKVKYAKFPATENLILFEPVNGGPIQIEVVNVRSNGL